MGQKLWCVAALASVLVVLHISYPAKRFDLHRGTPEAHGQTRVPLQTSSCSSVELSSGHHSRFLRRREHSAAKAGWFQLGILQSCCAKDRCQKSGGDVFLAFLDGQNSPRALMQPLVHDFGNGYYALLLPEDTLLPSGTYKLGIYLHEALNRSAYREVSGKVMPLADPQGQQDVLDALDVHRRGSKEHGDLQAVYLQVEKPLVTPIQVDWQWPGGNLKLWKAAVAQLPVCGPQFSASRRQGGFWLRLGGKHLPCKGFGRKGCGAFGLLLPDSEFHHVYLERRCYYPLRDDRNLQKCLFRDDLKVLLHGDSTTHGLLQEAQGMWSEVKPFKDALNKSESCRYNASGLGEGAPHDRWTSEFCNFRGESLLHDVVLDGRVVVSSPKQYFRKPRCHGLKNLQDEDVFPRFIKMIQEFDVLVMHSCDHDMCNLDFAKPRLLEEYQRNLRKFANVMRKHASGKRIIWLSCAAQSGLTSPFAHFSHMQVVKWRMDRLAFEMCQRNQWEFIDGFSLYSAAMLRPRWFDHRGEVGDLHTHSFCCPKGSLAEIQELRKSSDPLPYRLAFQGGAGYLSRMLVQLVFNQICHPPAKATMSSLDTRKPLTEGHWATTTEPRLTTDGGSTLPVGEAQNSDTEGCDLRQISSANVSKFVEVGMRPSEVKAGWLQFGMLRSCCGEDRCQTTGGDVFLAYLDGQQAPKALMQPSVHDFGNGSYALLLPEDTMLPTGTYKLSIYLHQALNRSAYRSLAGKAAWPVADIFAAQDILDSFYVHKSSSNESGDLRAVYVHLKATTSVPTWDVHWQWPGGHLEDWKSALSQLRVCRPQSAASRREGGFWLRLGKHVPCEGVGQQGCGAFSLLSPDSVFHHIYMERDCYYILRNDRNIQKCLGDDTKVLLLGDSTTHGLLQEALTMWSEVKPYINGLNKSEGCSFKPTWVPRKRKKISLWSSQVCSHRGETLLNDVVLDGRAAVSSPAQLFRTPQCQGLANLADSTISSRFAKLLQPYDILVLHSCSHDLCNYNYAKPRLLEQYRQNLRRLSKILRKYAPEKRIIWLSCPAQSGLNSTWMFTLTQVFKWRMDRIAFEMCKANGWEFIDGFSLYSAALLRERWFDHRGLAGDVHTHSHCCPRGNPNELEALRGRFDQLPYRLALQGGAGYLSRVLVQVIFNQICSPPSSTSPVLTLQSKTSPESRAVLPLPKSELPMENHWISEKVAENTCHPNELSSANVSKFVEVGMRPSEVKAGWLQFGMLRSCCGEDRCQTTGGDVFLAYLDGQQAPKALMQPSVHDFGNGSYALLLPGDTMLPTGTYKLSIYLHQALNRSAYRSLAGKTAAWPVADVFGRQNVLDPFDLQASSADLRAIYVHLKATTAVPTSDVHWQWPGGNLTLWKSALSQLPSCHQSSTASKREGGFWLELGQHVGVACSGVGKKGCGAFQLLSPDAAFHHLYLESDCYYPMRDAQEIQNCLGKMGKPRATVLLLGDSTTQGLLQEALGMWSEVKPFKNPWNKSDVCSYSESYSSQKKRVVGLWSSKFCDTFGEAETSSVVRLGGRGAVAMPLQHLRKPKCRGLGNLADGSVVHDLIEQIQKFDVLVLHSCDHDLCIEDGISKPRVLQHYWQNLQHLAKLLRKHAAGKRILWLSCAAQGNLMSTWKVTQAQVLKWRLDRLAFETCRQNGWEFIDGFSLISAALLKNRWFDHRGIAGNLHTHTHCCPRGSAAELEFLRQQEDQLPYKLAYQGGVGYLSKMLAQVIFNQICTVSA